MPLRGRNTMENDTETQKIESECEIVTDGGTITSADKQDNQR